MRTDRKGQAFVEAALGMFVFALILSALFTFGKIIPDSQRYRSLARWKAGFNAENRNARFDSALNGSVWSLSQRAADQFGAPLPALPPTASPHAEAFAYEVDVRREVGDFAADEIFGVDKIKLTDDVYIPGMRIPATERIPAP